MRFLQFWQVGLSPGHLVFLCRHGSHAWLIRWPREPPIGVSFPVLCRLMRLIATLELSGFTSTYGDDGGAMACIADGACVTEDEDDGWDTMDWREIRQHSFDAVVSRCWMAHLRANVVHRHPS